MKRAQLISLFTLAAFLVAGTTTGCKSPDKGITPIAGKSKPVGGVGPGSALGGGATTTGEPTATALKSDGTANTTSRDSFEGMEQDRAQFASDTVYFAFDSSTVKASEQKSIKNVADYLKSNRANKLLIEGHCDDRGTEEYNRSLGERRALSLREYLIRLGIDADRIRTLSLGKDKPAVPGNDEAAWSKNRRGEFVLLKPPV